MPALPALPPSYGQLAAAALGLPLWDQSAVPQQAELLPPVPDVTAFNASVDVNWDLLNPALSAGQMGIQPEQPENDPLLPFDLNLDFSE